jgi:hypothetical protein
MMGELIAIAVLLAVAAVLVAYFTDTADVLVLGALFVVLAAAVFFLNGWFFMLAVGNLGLEFGYWDSAITAGLFGACFTGLGTAVKAGSR